MTVAKVWTSGGCLLTREQRRSEAFPTSSSPPQSPAALKQGMRKMPRHRRHQQQPCSLRKNFLSLEGSIMLAEERSDLGSYLPTSSSFLARYLSLSLSLATATTTVAPQLFFPSSLFFSVVADLRCMKCTYFNKWPIMGDFLLFLPRA